MVLSLLIYIILIIIAIIVIFWLLSVLFGLFLVLPNAEGCQIACLRYSLINHTNAMDFAELTK